MHLQMAQRRADWRVGVYVRVHGHLRSFENKKSMVVFSLKVIIDFNEVQQCSDRLQLYCQYRHTHDSAVLLQVSFHFLQCIFQHVHLTRGQSQSGGMVSSLANVG